ncbi:MAG TPA: hypothetical protein VFK41_13355 [Nocardioidaceae bacterium]|nr:hypothetical protein [Nocardioidaceae bacterium]
MNKGNVSLALSTAALLLAAAAGGPAIARAIVPNADKVDGLDAVKSTATVKARKGKLVATSAKTGRLPNNIIAMAPNAARLGGFTPAQLRYIQLMPGAADMANGTTLSGGGALQFPSDDTTSNATWVFILPPDYKAGSPIAVDLYLGKAAGVGCSVAVQGLAAAGPVAGDQVSLPTKVDGVTDENVVSFPAAAGALTSKQTTLTITGTGAKPGMYLAVQVTRDSGDAFDNCATALLGIAGQARY